MPDDHFISNTLSELVDGNRSPIYGYQHLPLLTLEESVKDLIPYIPNIVDEVSKAKTNCNKTKTILSSDESAAIYLFTMPISFYSRLNEALRAKNRHELKKWFPFLKLFITAVEKLPSIKGIIWRGVCEDVGSVFADGELHKWWTVTSCSMDLKVVDQHLEEKTGTLFVIDASYAKNISTFSAFPEEKEIVLLPGTHLRARSSPLDRSRFIIVHLQEEVEESQSQSKPRYLFDMVKQEYLRYNRIERIMNSSKSFPIEQSYINLAIVDIKEQKEKEKQLFDARHNTNDIIDTFEEIYGTKTPIEIKDIFANCKDQTKQILVLGRAGIGKTTFCRYVTHQWATGTIWQQYELVIFIRLRNLTEHCYPLLTSGTKYSLTDLIKTEYFRDDLSGTYDTLLREELNTSRVLWILDGYDEIVQNIPPHLQYLLEQLLRTEHQILTSRPYSNSLSYTTQMEITGFTDDNITKYVIQFFDQIKDEIKNASHEAENLLNFLRRNIRIWGIAHIPVNLELICSLWCDADWSETTTLTMTAVYDKMIEWIWRRHLKKQNTAFLNKMTKDDVYEYLHKEVAFLECLAFNAVENKKIILSPTLLKTALQETKCSLQHQPHLLNIGVLKPFDYKPTGSDIELDKNHYFVHLSFQEYFAARYLIKALNGTSDQQKKAMDFFKTHKYNQRFKLIFAFTSGLLSEYNMMHERNLFWKTLLEEPLDLIGIRHVAVVISCLEHAGCDRNISQYDELMNLIIKWIKNLICVEKISDNHLILDTLRESPSLINQSEIVNAFIQLYQNGNSDIKESVSIIVSNLQITDSYDHFIQLHMTMCVDKYHEVSDAMFMTLGKMGEQAATNEVIDALVNLLGDTTSYVRKSACYALRNMGEKSVNSKVVNALMNLLLDPKDVAAGSACYALGQMGEKAGTSEVIKGLTNLLVNAEEVVTKSACYALGQMGEKAGISEVIKGLTNLLVNKNDGVRRSAGDALAKIGEKTTTNEVINGLTNLLVDTNDDVRKSVCDALGQMGGRSATTEVIKGITNLLVDTSDGVRRSACYALGNMGKKAATYEVLDRLTNLLVDTNSGVRRSACDALGQMGEKAGTSEVIKGLTSLLIDAEEVVAKSACYALGQMGEKAGTSEVIKGLTNLFIGTNDDIQRSACDALAKIGEKTTTNEVINELTRLLVDTNGDIRKSVCDALGQIGEKAGTSEVIKGLTNLLVDTNDDVRRSACSALGQMGEKSATSEVINRLTNLLVDTNDDVRISACSALRNMGKKVATCEVLDKLMNLFNEGNQKIRDTVFDVLINISKKGGAMEVIQRIFDLKPAEEKKLESLLAKIALFLPCMSNLHDDAVRILLKYVEQPNLGFLMRINLEKFVQAYIISKIPRWLPIIRKTFTSRGYALTVSEKTVTIYGSEMPVEFPLPNKELGQTIQNFFAK